ncbi:MAG: cation-transporting P-type ATPase, partial [Steroidobacter sp.]
MNHLPKPILSPAFAKPAGKSIHFAPILEEVARMETSEVFAKMNTSLEGLSAEDASRRHQEAGSNVVAASNHRGWPWRLLVAMRNPLVILLIVLATISLATGDARAASVMALMVVLSVLLRFVQESRADAAAEKLRAMINVTATVVRAAKEQEIALDQLVPGDVVKLSAGDMVPADVRLIATKDLFI